VGGKYKGEARVGEVKEGRELKEVRKAGRGWERQSRVLKPPKRKTGYTPAWAEIDEIDDID